MVNNTSAPAKVVQPHNKKKVVVLILVIAIAGSGLFVWSQGYIVDIARFFAFEPAGYVPIERNYAFVFPHGGGAAIAGGQYSIRWNAHEFPSGEVTISLDQGEERFLRGRRVQRSRVIVENQQNTGSYMWEIPSDVIGEGYTVHISGGGVSKDSRSSFAVLPAAPIVVRSIPLPATEPAWQPGSQDIPVLAYEIINPHDRAVQLSFMELQVDGTVDPRAYSTMTWDRGGPSAGAPFGSANVAAVGPGHGGAALELSGPDSIRFPAGPLGCLNNCPSVFSVGPGQKVIVYMRVDTKFEPANGSSTFSCNSCITTLDRLPIEYQLAPIKGPTITIAGPVLPPPVPKLTVSPVQFERNSRPQVNASIDSAAPNERIYVFLERPDGTLMSDDRVNDLFTRYYPCPCSTDDHGKWIGGVVVPLASEGQVGTYTAWVQVGKCDSPSRCGISNKIPIQVTHAGVSIPPPPPPTPTPQSGVELRFRSADTAAPVRQGETVSVPLLLDTRGFKVTAIEVHAVLEGQGRLDDVVFNDDRFPAVLQDVAFADGGVRFTIGSGPTGGVSGTAIEVATLIFTIEDDAELDARLSLEITPNSRVTAEGIVGNVLTGGTGAIYVVAGTLSPGDADGDGDVDIFDYNLVVSNFGIADAQAGDLDNDGDVDIFDYNLVISNFGN